MRAVNALKAFEGKTVAEIDNAAPGCRDVVIYFEDGSRITFANMLETDIKWESA